jgi:hypothetical protein
VLGKLRLPLCLAEKERGTARIPLGERHLRCAVREYTEHYHLEHSHQGLENELIERCSRDFRGNGAVECQERLGGMLRYYRREA